MSFRGVCVASVVLGAALAGCGGGDKPGSGSEAVFTSRAAVADETAQIIAVIGTAGGSAGSASQPKYLPARSATIRRTGRSGGDRVPEKSASVTPRATESCDSGSYDYDYAFGPRTLPLFSTTRDFDYYFEEDHMCTFELDGSTVTYDGYSESGFDESECTDADPCYDYAISGRGSTPYTLIFSSGDGELTFTALGREEFRYTDVVEEARTYVAVEIQDDPADDAPFSAAVDLGRSNSDALIERYNVSTETYEVDGPLSYSTSVCKGGLYRLTTITPITTDSQQGYVNGGQVKVESRGDSVTVTFNQDGSMTYQTADGSTGSVSRAELDAVDSCFDPG